VKEDIKLNREHLINLPQRLAEKYGKGDAIKMRCRLSSFPHQVLELRAEGQLIGYISWGSGFV
jgi:hypothetical protein